MKQGASAQKYARGLPTGKSAISTTNFNARRYGANMMDARDMWKDPAILRQFVDMEQADAADDLRVFATVKRCEDDTEYFETDPEV